MEEDEDIYGAGHVQDIEKSCHRHQQQGTQGDNSGDQGRLYRATKALLLIKDDSCMNK